MIVHWHCRQTSTLLKPIHTHTHTHKHTHTHPLTHARNVELYNLLGVQSVADVIRRSRLSKFGHLERRSVDDWVSTSRRLEVVGVKCILIKRKTWEEHMDKDIKVLGLHLEWAEFWDMWRNFLCANV